jgi:hypothetical protein
MKKLPIEQKVHIDGPADQWPFERVVGDGVILDNTGRKYLVGLKSNRENLLFFRRDLSPI